MQSKQILLASPRGFCAGVDRAIHIVEQALARFGAPIYVKHEVVHNHFVVENLKHKGAVFIEDLASVPAGSRLIYSAHGVSQAVRREAQSLGLIVFDATCPLVTKVHLEVKKFSEQQWEIIMIGHAGHPEVEGTMGQCDEGIYLVQNVEDVEHLSPKDPSRLAYVTQTTLSVDEAGEIIEALEKRFPTIRGPQKKDICYATQNRQDAVKMLASRSSVVIVIGSKNSSNSNRLREVVAARGVPAYQIDYAHQLQEEWFKEASCVGITAGASAPENLVQEVVEIIRKFGCDSVETVEVVQEHVTFNLPKGLI